MGPFTKHLHHSFAGNSGNVPFILGALAGIPNSLSVGATLHPDDESNAGVMAEYSSRGPGPSQLLRPDIVAPSGLKLAAAGTGTFRYRKIEGTSFSAPLVAGAAALVMERCPDCSPFAIKALLMNNANRATTYSSNNPELSPVTLSGAGELQMAKTLDADIWAYSIEDVQPSISLGLINAASDVVVKRVVKVINMSGTPQSLQVRYQLRKTDSISTNVLKVEFNNTQLRMNGDCNNEAEFVEVTFTIRAADAPPNHMTSTGSSGFDPEGLDVNEFGGHIIIESTTVPTKDISLPFVAIIRRASDLTSSDFIIRDFNEGDAYAGVDLRNEGAETAQVDAFQLLLLSRDNPESSFGESIAPNDIREVGYRVLDVGEPGCSHLVEFAFSTWERTDRMVTEILGVEIDLDGDGEGDRMLYNSQLGEHNFVVDVESFETTCTGLEPDHSTGSTNTILRACAEDLGLSDFDGKIGISFFALSLSPSTGQLVTTEDIDGFVTVDFPKPALSAPSFDISPGATIQRLPIEGTGIGSGRAGPVGLMLVTNSYRTPSSTGAASSESETLILLREEFENQPLPQEITPDELQFPAAQSLEGPICSIWKQEVIEICELDMIDPDITGGELAETLETLAAGQDSIMSPFPLSFGLMQQSQTAGMRPICPRKAVPRATALQFEASPTSAPVDATTEGDVPASSPISFSFTLTEQEQEELGTENSEPISRNSTSTGTNTKETIVIQSENSGGLQLRTGLVQVFLGVAIGYAVAF